MFAGHHALLVSMVTNLYPLLGSLIWIKAGNRVSDYRGHWITEVAGLQRLLDYRGYWITEVAGLLKDS